MEETLLLKQQLAQLQRWQREQQLRELDGPFFQSLEIMAAAKVHGEIAMNDAVCLAKDPLASPILQAVYGFIKSTVGNIVNRSSQFAVVGSRLRGMQDPLPAPATSDDCTVTVTKYDLMVAEMEKLRQAFEDLKVQQGMAALEAQMASMNAAADIAAQLVPQACGTGQPNMLSARPTGVPGRPDMVGLLSGVGAKSLKLRTVDSEGPRAVPSTPLNKTRGERTGMPTSSDLQEMLEAKFANARTPARAAASSSSPASTDSPFDPDGPPSSSLNDRARPPAAAGSAAILARRKSSRTLVGAEEAGPRMVSPLALRRVPSAVSGAVPLPRAMAESVPVHAHVPTNTTAGGGPFAGMLAAAAQGAGARGSRAYVPPALAALQGGLSAAGRKQGKRSRPSDGGWSDDSCSEGGEEEALVEIGVHGEGVRASPAVPPTALAHLPAPSIKRAVSFHITTVHDTPLPTAPTHVVHAPEPVSGVLRPPMALLAAIRKVGGSSGGEGAEEGTRVPQPPALALPAAGALPEPSGRKGRGGFLAEIGSFNASALKKAKGQSAGVGGRENQGLAPGKATTAPFPGSPARARPGAPTGPALSSPGPVSGGLAGMAAAHRSTLRKTNVTLA